MYCDLSDASPVRRLNNRRQAIPEIFCWTKMGTEAGQPLEAILQRKELERQAGNGVFAWGIGNSLGNGVELARQVCPEGKIDVLFTPMKSAPKQIDVTPSKILLWTSYLTTTGQIAPLPRHLLITSRGSADKRTHYALLCYSGEQLQAEEDQGFITANNARNLASLNPIGASQVTSLVRYYSDIAPQPEKPYRITFRATLHQQGFLKLLNPVVLEGRSAQLYAAACKAKEANEWADFVKDLRNTVEKESQRSLNSDLFADFVA